MGFDRLGGGLPRLANLGEKVVFDGGTGFVKGGGFTGAVVANGRGIDPHRRFGVSQGQGFD